MVSKIFNALSREIVSIHGIAYLLAFFAVLSQILALVRDRLLASSFGAGSILDVYYAAFRIPDLIFITVASLVSISIIVPFFIEKKEQGEDIKSLINSVFSVFFFIILICAVLAFFLIPFISKYLFPGFSKENLNLLISLSRILLISPFLLGLSNFFASLVQMHNRFFLYALSPILYNVGIIFGILVFYPRWGINGLAFGVVFGAFLHLMIQIPFILAKKEFPKLSFRIKDFQSVKKIILLSIPRTITLSTGGISAFVLVSIASLLGAGSIAIFNFSFNLQTGPLSIIGVSYASAIFPVLSRLFVQGNRKMFLEKMINVTKHIIFWSMPATALFIVLRAQIVRTVLGAGNFSWSDTRLTAAALAIFAISIIPQSLILLFIRAFYSEGKTKKPLFINLLSMFVTIFSAFILILLYKTYPTFAYFFQSLLRVENVSGSSVTMLALAYSLGIIFNTTLHWIAFEYEFPSFTKSIIKCAFQSFAASVLSGFVAYHALSFFDDVLNINTLIGIFLQGFCAGVVGLIFGFFILKILKSEELDEVLRTLHKKIFKVEKSVVIDELV